MIAYSLRCHKGHEFEGWFRDSKAFDAQSSAGHLTCPSCNSVRIEKAIMAPAVSGTKKTVHSKAPSAQQMRQFATGLRKYVQENADYVGPDFAEEARKIHYGERPDRHIYGEATPKEAQELVEEGVDVAPLPRSGCSQLAALGDDHVVDVHIGRQFPVPPQGIERNALSFQDA